MNQDPTDAGLPEAVRELLPLVAARGGQAGPAVAELIRSLCAMARQSEYDASDTQFVIRQTMGDLSDIAEFVRDYLFLGHTRTAVVKVLQDSYALIPITHDEVSQTIAGLSKAFTRASFDMVVEALSTHCDLPVLLVDDEQLLQLTQELGYKETIPELRGLMMGDHTFVIEGDLFTAFETIRNRGHRNGVYGGIPGPQVTRKVTMFRVSDGCDDTPMEYVTMDIIEIDDAKNPDNDVRVSFPVSLLSEPPRLRRPR